MKGKSLRRYGPFGVAVAALTFVATASPSVVVRGAATAVVAAGAAVLLRRLMVESAVAQDSLSRAERSIGHLWGLMPLLKLSPLVVPPLGGAALDFDAAHALALQLMSSKPETIVELGPGGSTAVIDLVRRQLGTSWHHVCVEHDTQYYDLILRYRDLLQIECDVVLAPLKHQEVGSWVGEWYDPAMLDRLPARIDALVIDGPPDVTGRGVRAAALYALLPRMAAGSWVLVDDAGREAESQLVDSWVQAAGATIVRRSENWALLKLPGTQ